MTRFGTCSFAISVPPGAKGALQTPRYPSDAEVSLPDGCRGEIQVEVEIDLRTGRHEHVQSTATGERIPLDAIAYCKDVVTKLWRSDIRVPRSARRSGSRPRLVVTIPLEDGGVDVPPPVPEGVDAGEPKPGVHVPPASP